LWSFELDYFNLKPVRFIIILSSERDKYLMNSGEAGKARVIYNKGGKL